MSYSRTSAILAMTCALLLTIGDWWKVMIYKNPPHENLALWLPFVVLLRAHDIFAILISLLQFPALAMLFIFAGRRWHSLKVLSALIFAYTLCVWVAVLMLKAGLWT